MRSIFNTPVVTPVLRFLAKCGLSAAGWRLEGDLRPQPPLVLIGAPHTSNWDCLLLVALALQLHVKVCWLGKNTLFRFPFGPLMRWLGGIPINRSERSNQVERTVQFMRENRDLLLCVTPEGTRAKVDRWKTGFYHIAHQADVPLLLAVIDGDARCVILQGIYHTTGNPERDIPEVQEVYRGYNGIVPENTFELPPKRPVASDDAFPHTSSPIGE